MAPSPALIFNDIANNKISVCVKPNTLAAKIPPSANRVTSPSLNNMRANRKRIISGMALAVRMASAISSQKRPFTGVGAGFGTNKNNGSEKISAHKPAKIIVALTCSACDLSSPKGAVSGMIKTAKASASATTAPTYPVPQAIPDRRPILAGGTI